MAESDKIIEKSYEDYDIEQRKLIIQKYQALQKDINSEDPDKIIKAVDFLKKDKKAKVQSSKTYGFGEQHSRNQAGVIEKEFIVNETLLNRLGETILIKPIINAYITRINEYMHFSENKYTKGFRIEKRTDLFEDKKTTQRDRRNIAYLTEFLMNTGDRDSLLVFDDIADFNAKFLHNSLVLDAGCSELVHDITGNEFLYFKHVDAKYIRKLECYDQKTNIHRYKKNQFGYYPTYTQLKEGNPYVYLYPNEFIYMVRNPSPDMEDAGYGRPEVKTLSQVIVDFLNSNKYNSREFKATQPKGFLIAKDPQATEGQGEELMQHIERIAKGVENAHNMLVVDGADYEWIDLEKKRDMNFLEYIQYLIKLSCALYRITPEEINFPVEGINRTSLGGSGKQEQYDQYEKMGLFPLLRRLEKVFDRIINQKSNGEYRFRFYYDFESKESELERLIKESSSFKTINEVRNHLRIDPSPEGNIILSQVYLNTIMNKMITSERKMKEEEDGKAVDKVVKGDAGVFSDQFHDAAKKILR